MAIPVNSDFHDRWASGLHVGGTKPTGIVKVRRGLLDKHYAAYTLLDGSTPDFGYIKDGGHDADPWQGFWRFTADDWLTVPNVSNIEVQGQFDNDGIEAPKSCTVTIENIVFKAIAGVAGLYHQVLRGYLSPTLGFLAAGRIAGAAVENEWFDVLNGGFMVKVWQGYGPDHLEPAYVGVIDDTDVRVTPDEITITCRSFGAALTDQRVFGDNKAHEIGSPIVFADRVRTEADATLHSKHWILVDDAADVVKWALMWAGFHEWEVEPFGVRLKDPVYFHQADYLVDIIRWGMKQSSNRTFWIDRPSENDYSLGVPRFKHSVTFDAPAPALSVTDGDLLTGLETKFTKENLSFIIRVRGKQATSAVGGDPLGEDRTSRIHATYFPPWSGAHRDPITGDLSDDDPGRLTGIRKHVTHSDPYLETADECMMAALLIAVAEALTSWIGTIELPGTVAADLNSEVSILSDVGAVNSRLALSSLTSTMALGQNGSWTLSLSGALIDTHDMNVIAADYEAFLAHLLA